MRFDSTTSTLLVLGTSSFCGMTAAFVSKSHTIQNQNNRKTKTSSPAFGIVETRRYQVLYDDFEGFSFFGDDNSDSNNDNNNNSQTNSKNDRLSASGRSDADFYASLLARQAAFQQQGDSRSATSNFQNQQEDLEESMESWRGADCVSTVRLTLQDWIRRISIDSYPLAVCGTAGGHLYLADLQRGEQLDSALCVHAARSVDGKIVMQRKQNMAAQDTEESINDSNDGEEEKEAFFASLPSRLPDHMEEAIETLYGDFDGGGIIGLAMKDDWIVSSGREGGVHLCRIRGEEQDVYKGSRGGTSRQTKLSLQRLGKFRGLEEDATVVTSLAFDETGTLWMGGYDGILRGFDYEEMDSDDEPLMLRQRWPFFQVNLNSSILNLSINDELGVGVASTLNRGIVLFSLEDGEVLGKWNPFVKKIRKEFVRSALILKDTSGGRTAWSVVCGGSKGGLFQRQLSVDSTGHLTESKPFLDQHPGENGENDDVFPLKMRPNHMQAVVALASPFPGLLVTGSLDGSMRVWDYSAVKPAKDDEDDDEEADEDDIIEMEAQYDDVGPSQSRPQCLYALSGYKVWLGSIFATPKKLVSDGADNTIIVHSFEDEEEVLFSEDDDEEEFEGFL